MVSLNQINEEAEKRFGPFVVEDVPGGDVTLRNAIRLQKAERHKIGELAKRIQSIDKASATEDDVLPTLREFITTLGVGDGGERLLGALGDDLASLVLIFELYAEATQLGEALRSAS